MRTAKSKGEMMTEEEKATPKEYLKNENGAIQCTKLKEVIDETKAVLYFLSDTASTTIIGFHFPKPFLIGTSNFLSARKTRENILFCCERASFSDANALLRKYRDDLFQYLYF